MWQDSAATIRNPPESWIVQILANRGAAIETLVPSVAPNRTIRRSIHRCRESMWQLRACAMVLQTNPRDKTRPPWKNCWLVYPAPAPERTRVRHRLQKRRSSPPFRSPSEVDLDDDLCPASMSLFMEPCTIGAGDASE